MEKIWIIYRLLNEYEQNSIDLWIQNKVLQLINHTNEYNKDLKAEKDRELIDDEIAKNFEMRWYMNEVINYIEDNESRFALNLVYDDLNKEIREVIWYVADNKNEFDNFWFYTKFFSDFVVLLAQKRLISLSEFKNKYKPELLKEGIDISDKSFYLRIKNDLFDLVNKINFDYIYGVQNKEIDSDDIIYEEDVDSEIAMNKANLKVIFDLIDTLCEDKNIVLWDLKKWLFWAEFEFIKEFMYVNEENINLLVKNSIYYLHFTKIVTLIEFGWTETIWEIESYLEEELNENTFDKVTVNKWYYDEMKEELFVLVRDLNNLLIIWKNN